MSRPGHVEATAPCTRRARCSLCMSLHFHAYAYVAFASARGKGVSVYPLLIARRARAQAGLTSRSVAAACSACVSARQAMTSGAHQEHCYPQDFAIGGFGNCPTSFGQARDHGTISCRKSPTTSQYVSLQVSISSPQQMPLRSCTALTSLHHQATQIHSTKT